MFDIGETTTVSISVEGLEIIALKKLSLVSHALGEKIGGEAGREQRFLAKTLDDVIRRIELAGARLR
jgi:hypothetical protein